MIRKFKNDKVFYLSIIFLLTFIIFSLGNLNTINKVTSNLVSILSTKFGWFYISAMTLFLATCIYLLFSKYKVVRLGKDDERPKYSFISWFAMLFSAGMGIGLVFFGVSEPLSHYINPLGMSGMTDEARNFALSKSFLHWGISAWACYAILALAVAYFQFRKNKPMLISSIIEPIIGEKNRCGIMGTSVDIFTIFATIAGVVTSLGMGTLQINGGLNYLFNVPTNIWVQMVIISVITVCFLMSATAGLDSGIQKISNINLILAFVLFSLCFLIGPTLIIIQNFFIGLVHYVPELIKSVDPTVSGDWYSEWTIFYWAYWICWAPPVAIFIARISRGRTIKEFILGVLIVPSIVCLIWFATFGTLGFQVSPDVALDAYKVTEIALFKVLAAYPLGTTMSIIALMLIATFFITSADSTTFVLGMISSNGNLNPSNGRKIVLGMMISILTVVFLFAGGLEMIQNISIIAAFPFAIIMILCLISFIKVLKTEDIDLINESKEKIKNENMKTNPEGILTPVEG